MVVIHKAQDPNRFDRSSADRLMTAVVTIGTGGYDQLQVREVPIASPGPGEVLLHVLAAGINNTDINSRIGWYGSTVTVSTQEAIAKAETEQRPSGWNEATPFPLIQGTDCCGRVVAVAPDVRPSLLGQRVLVRPCMKQSGFGVVCTWMGSDFDGAFAQFVTVPASEIFAVTCDLSDCELGAIPCAFGTAENMLHRARVVEGEHVLVVGASGGVASAAVQLAKRRGAVVTALTAKEKIARLQALGADAIIDRDADIAAILGEHCVDVIVDNVAGPSFGSLLRLLKKGGRCACSGAIGGPLVTIDMRILYLNDLTLLGCTAWDDVVFPTLISYIECGALRPILAQTFPLEEIVQAQKEFLKGTHIGKFVLVPPALEE
jgi:NADPH:quinone reductase-like Zn-dependent oxidoreductase